MSSQNILENNQNTENNNLIKEFSRNIVSNFHALKIANLSNKKENDASKNKKLNKKEVIQPTKLSNKTILDSLNDFNLLSSPPIMKSRPICQKTMTNPKRKETLNDRKSAKKKKIKNKYYPILSSFKGEQTTSIQSNLETNNDKKLIYKNKISEKSKSKSREKNSSSDKYKSFKLDSEPFIERLYQYKENKRKKLNALRQRLMEEESTENKKPSKVLKHSLFLIGKKYNKNSLQKNNEMKEKNIEKNCIEFYARTLPESRSCSFFGKTLNFSIKRFNEFYDNKMKWKNNVEEKIKKNKITKEQIQENTINKLDFKPSLNKKSLNMMKQKNKEKQSGDNYDQYNHRESLDKYKIKLKNIINHFYGQNDLYIFKKKKNIMKRSNTQINISTNLNLIKKNNKLERIKPKKKNTIINKKRKEENKKNINDNFNDINKYTYILKKKEKFKKKRNKKNKEIDIYAFYRINVSTGCAWMPQSFNQINYNRKYKHLIKESIF